MAQERLQINTMSVELALKRELAYREKLAKLYPDDDNLKSFKPIQVPSAAAAKTQSENLAKSSISAEVYQISIPNPPFQKPSSATILSPNSNSTVILESMSMSMAGGVCQQQNIFPNSSSQKLSLTKIASHHQMPSSSNVIPAADSTTTNQQQQQQPDQFQTSKSTTHLFCKVCKVSCSSSFNYKQHVRGQKHKNKLKMQLQGGRNNNNTTKTYQQQQPRCNICQIWCTDENTLKLHFDGQKHKAKMLREIEFREKGVVLLNQQVWCQLCQVPCPDEDSLRMHFKGKNHIARLYNTTNGGLGEPQ